MKRIAIVLFAAIFAMNLNAAGKNTTPKSQNIFKANDTRVTWVGRTLSDENGTVSSQWSGTMAKISFKGSYLAIRVSDSNYNYFNVWIDSNEFIHADKEIMSKGKDTLIVLAEGLKKGEHNVVLQRKTEGSCGKFSLSEIVTDGELLQAEGYKPRHIEFIGDSYTCGYGTEDSSKSDKYSPESQNCNYAYGCIIARYFDADYTLISHSGQGVARNYGGGGKPYTMVDRYDRVFDEDKDIIWDASKAPYKPDIVVIYLGTNDFSRSEQPSKNLWCRKYNQLIGKIKKNYGENIPVLCYVSRLDFVCVEYVEYLVSTTPYKNVHMCAQFGKIHNNEDELGADNHPNYKGQIKSAHCVIPYIATLTGWPMQDKSIK